MYCKECKFCYPMKMEKPNSEKKYICVYNAEAYTNSPFMTPTIPSIDVCNCIHFDDKNNREVQHESDSM